MIKPFFPLSLFLYCVWIYFFVSFLCEEIVKMVSGKTVGGDFFLFIFFVRLMMS